MNRTTWTAAALVGVGLLLSPRAAGQAPERPATDNHGSRMNAMHSEFQAQDRYAEVHGLRLHYRAWGEPEAPPLLILHGLTGHAWEFDPLAAALADDFRVLVVNQRGHGASDWAEDYSPELMADDVAALVETLGLGRVTVIGHSMGGVNGWWLAARHPEQVERLVILDVTPAVIASDDAVGYWAPAFDAYAQARYTDPENAVAEYLAAYTGAHREELRAFVRNNLAEDTDGRWRWRFDAPRLIRWMTHASADEAAHWSMLRRIAAPTLLVRAADSPFTDPSAMERMAREIPEARLIEIPDAGHDIHIDQREALLTELRAFLSAP